jgi:hypothetical protein
MKSKHLAQHALAESAALGGTAPMREWIGHEPATAFSY